ncbi:lipase member H-A-like isoform X2 [Lycorma delicatula]
MAEPIVEIRKAYQEIGGKNILIIDWGKLAVLPCYPTAVLNTAQVGQCSAEFVAEIIKKHHPRYVHIIGFSLGAHIASFVGNYVRDSIGRKIRRITGLDPALPLFANLKGTYKLDKNDAQTVDVIHTNVGTFGKMEPTGHVDFYVNNGSSQPACINHHNPPLCSHLLAPTYYAESITSKTGFWGTSCPSYFQYVIGWCPLPEPERPEAKQRIIMGEYLLRGSRGVYIVKTRSSPPYALG